MKEKHKILIFCMILAANGAFGQQNRVLGKQFLPIKAGFRFFSAPDVKTVNLSLLSVSGNVPGNYYCSQLGFFCKKELQVEAVTKIPFKFRLGSLQYNDWLEGKKNAGILPVY